MEFENKKLRDVADIAARIMMGEKALHPNQQKLDVHEPEKDELTAKDFEMLRKGKKSPEVKKEEVEQIDELKKSTMGSYVKKASKDLHNTSFDHGEDEHRQYGEPDGPFGDPDAEETMKKRERDIENRQKGINRAATKLSKEEVEELDEVSLKTATSAYVKRMGDDGPNEKSSIAKATKTMDHIAKKHGVRGVARATKTADDKYGLNDPVHNPRKAFVKQTMANVKKEEIDQAAATILEYESKDGKFVHRARPGAYGGTKDEKHAVDTLAGPKTKELKAIESEKKKKMSEMVATYKEQGLKGLFEALKKDEFELDEGTMDGITLHDDNDGGHNVHYKGQQIGSVWKRKSGTWAHYHDDSGDNDHKHSNKKEAIQAVKNAHSMSEGVIVEEPTSAEFDAQLADAKQRAAGTKKQPEVSKPAVQAVQNEETHTTVEVWDLDTTNGVQISEIDLEERSLSEPEMKKKEEIVKSMKKGISGFKERYGKDAKSVMYATATARAKGE
jgi:hypothetical protein